MTKKLSVPMTHAEQTLGFIYWLFQLLLLPPILALSNEMLPKPLSDTALNFVFFCVNFLALTVMLHRFLLVSGRSALRRPGFVLQSAFLAYAVYYLASLVISGLILWLCPDFLNINDDSIARMLRENYTLTTVGTVLLAPIAEELMYRGVIFRALYQRSRVAAYLVSTLLFAAVHLLGYITVYDPLTLALACLQYIPAGLCLGWAYVRSDNIWAPILVHIAVNQIGLLSMR